MSAPETAALRGALASSLRLTLPAAPPTPLTSTLAVLRQRADTERTATPRHTRVLYRFLLDGHIGSFPDLLALCTVAGSAGGWDGRRLLDEARRFPELLAAVALLPDGRSFDRAYRALLGSYFAYPAHLPAPRQAAQGNWQRLRHFLMTHRSRIAADGSEWVSTLQAQLPLLETPEQAASPDASIRRQLRIPADGWPGRLPAAGVR